MHAVLIGPGGSIPLPRVGGALSHAAGSIRNLPRRCQTGVCQASRFGREVEGARKRREGPSIREQAASCGVSVC
jgi:hypothetical protein